MSKSEKMRAFWANPENRKRVTDSMNSPETHARRMATWTQVKRDRQSARLESREVKSSRRLPDEIMPDEEELYRYLTARKRFKRAEAIAIVVGGRKKPAQQMELFDA